MWGSQRAFLPLGLATLRSGAAQALENFVSGAQALIKGFLEQGEPTQIAMCEMDSAKGNEARGAMCSKAKARLRADHGVAPAEAIELRYELG